MYFKITFNVIYFAKTIIDAKTQNISRKTEHSFIADDKLS